MKHEDNRRTLYDWCNIGEISNKVVFVKEPINIGDHYHNNKDEHFFLVHGKFLEMQLGAVTFYDLDAPYIVNVPKGTYHRFICEPGSILVGVATKLFDQNDEIK